MTVMAVKTKKQNRVRETRKDRIFNAINLLFWIIVLFITLYPLWLILIASVSDPAKVLIWPVDFSLMGYEAVFQNSELLSSYLNSIFYTVVGSALSVIVSLAAAYALSRKFAGKKYVNLAITFTMFFSGGLIPIFLNVRDLGLYNTRTIMILMNLVSVWNLMVARTYIQTSIPEDLYEAAVIDGSGHFTYFFKCVLPLSGTIIAVLSVYYGVARWNDYFTGLVMLRDRSLYPLQLVLREILASLTSTGSSDTFFAAYADNLGGLQAALRNRPRGCAVCLHAEILREGRHDRIAQRINLFGRQRRKYDQRLQAQPDTQIMRRHSRCHRSKALRSKTLNRLPGPPAMRTVSGCFRAGGNM